MIEHLRRIPLCRELIDIQTHIDLNLKNQDFYFESHLNLKKLESKENVIFFLKYSRI